MKPLSGLVARALCLLAAIGLSALIVFVHAADPTSLGARAVVASGVTRVAPAPTATASLVATIAVAGRGVR